MYTTESVNCFWSIKILDVHIELYWKNIVFLFIKHFHHLRAKCVCGEGTFRPTAARRDGVLTCNYSIIPSDKYGINRSR